MIAPNARHRMRSDAFASLASGRYELLQLMYDAHRPHQSRDQRPPLHDPDQPIDLTAVIERRSTVAGLVHEYRRAA
jgi:hypothetical protein